MLMSKLSGRISETSQLGATTWKVTLKSVLNSLANWRTIRLTSFMRFPHCLDDHHINPEDLEIVGELSETCSQIVLKCLCLARIGRPQLRRTVNCSAMISHKLEPERFARLKLLISHIQNTSKNDTIVTLEIKQQTAGNLTDSKVNVRWCAMHIWVAHSLMPLSWAFLKGKPLFPISAQKLDMCSFVQDYGWKTFQH